MKNIKKFVVLLFVFSLFSLNVYAFEDVQQGDLYFDAISYLENSGVVQGYSDGEFKSNRRVSRSEFLKMLIEMSEIDPGNMTGCFEDVKGDWSEKYVCYAKSVNWVNGYDDGSFKPSKEVNFVEAMKMTKNAFYPYGFLHPLEENEDWFYPYVNFLDAKGVDVCEVKAYDEFLTRGMVAELLYSADLSIGKSYSELNTGKCVLGHETYQDLGMEYYKFRGDVYFAKMNAILYLADAETFERIDEHIGRDKNYVFSGADIIIGADPFTYEILGYMYLIDRAWGKDKNNIYYGLDVYEDADYSSFEVLADDYLKDKNGVYLMSKWSTLPLIKIEGADPMTFKLLSYFYGKDKLNIFYKKDLIENVDYTSFEVIERAPFMSYSKDKNNIYYGSLVVEGADVNTFEFVGNEGYAKDINSVFWLDQVLSWADPDTFEIFNNDFYLEQYLKCDVCLKDKDHVFVNDDFVFGADPDSFEYLGERYWKDKNNVYINGVILEGADSLSFEKLNYLYSRDINNVYFNIWNENGFILDEVDVASFEVLEDGYAKDKNNIYFEGVIVIGADVASFEVLSEQNSTSCYMYAMDKNYIYKEGSVFEGAVLEHLPEDAYC
ncbi:MAG: DKNYY domain-containing protein [Candidatus Gracilibacteria bacterium]|jgi:hypothetical protein|nr:DKNYY domain-containing protein [Candidatus Gracilibacteria bacterium]